MGSPSPPARSFECDRIAHSRKNVIISESFDALGLRPELLRAVRDLGFTQPTPVQLSAIPAALAGRDILASAATGSGKSAAFGLPILHALAEMPRGKTRALVLAPTRELAAQIAAHLSALARHTKVAVAPVYGGVGFAPQVAAFRRGTDIIVATPGRLLDHLAHGAKLDDVTTLVIDEADRMLDMGFLPDVRRVLRRVPAKRQTLFFSATIPAAIATLSKEILHDPVRVDLSPQTTPAQRITQTVYSIDQQRKSDLLLELLKRDNAIYSAIAFTRTKSRANRLAAMLEKHDVKVERIHGDRSQSQRTRALDDFKRGKYRVLVATDIAARGIDIVELGHVVNYDVPLVPEDYVHRVGRTARASASGDAITFVAPDEEKYFAQIERALGRRLDRAKNPPLPAKPASPPPQPRRGRPSQNASDPPRRTPSDLRPPRSRR